MSHQQPIFEQGLFGKANGFVCNAWTESSNIVSMHEEGIAWAQAQVRAGSIETRFLAKLTAATPISANRWLYSGVALAITAAHGPTGITGSFGTFTLNAINLRELRNTASAADGSPLPSGASIGPVGSTWANSAWSTTVLEGYCEVTAAHDTSGGVFHWFDCPNPTRCGT
jgi:hypothetical protein